MLPSIPLFQFIHMQASEEPYYAFTYPHSESRASSSSSASSPPPPYTPEPHPYREIDLSAIKLHDPSGSSFSPLTTSKPLGDVGRFGDALSSRKAAATARFQIAHPYSRLQAKKGEVKRRKIWNHALEKHIFSPYEM